MKYAWITVFLALAFILFSKILEVLKVVLWRPYALTKAFRKQGISGPPYTIFSGSLDEIQRLNKVARETVHLDTNSDILQRVQPHFHKWFSEYGNVFLYWNGLEPNLCISDPELSKQVLSNRFVEFYVKPLTVRPSIVTLAGKGLVLLNGQDWVRHRSIINPAFSVDRLKIMVKRMAECGISMIEEWKNQVSAAKESSAKIEVSREFQRLTADIIALTAFGSDYVHGKEAFEAQREIQLWAAATNTNIFFPGCQYLPTTANKQIWKLDKKVKSSLRHIIEGRLNSKISNNNTDSPYGGDLLGLMLSASEATEANENTNLSKDEVIEECKTFFFAGHDTTSNLLTWAMLLLSEHRHWQEKLREEVLNECGMEIPDATVLPRFKLVNMVLLEVLRLYSPVILMTRETTKTIELGNLTVPKNTIVSIPTLKIHRSKEYWGEDANEFNPMRFANGISKAAKHPNALLGFGIGPRACIGQNFAIMEGKVVLALILQRFAFSLSADYKHAPVNYVTLHPEFGLPILLQPLSI